MKKILFFLVIVSGCALMAAQSFAAPEKLMEIGLYGSWHVRSFTDGGKKVCFVFTDPQKEEGKYNKKDRGEVHFFVTRWSGEKDKNVVNVSIGYTFKPDSQATVTMNGKKFVLFTQGGTAWTKDQAEDNAVVAELHRASSMEITGTSSRGTLTKDTYSLKGTTAAFQVLNKECSGK